MSTKNARPAPHPPRVESGSRETKPCPAPGCRKIAFPGHGFCTPCWQQLDARGRSRVYAAWAAHQRDGSTRSLREYYDVVIEVAP